MPDLSDEYLDVLIPHYRDPEGLALSLRSIATQDWLTGSDNRLRVIVFDDGSPPEELERVKAHCAQFCAQSGQALDLIVGERNHGRPQARNNLLDAVRAPYLAWLDAGDLWYPRKLSVQFDHLATIEATIDEPERFWVTCAYDWDQYGQRRARQQCLDSDPLRALLEGTDLRAYLWTLLGRTEAFAIAGQFDPALPRLQDLDYFLTFLRAGGMLTAPTDLTPLCCYVKSDIGRDARDIATSHARVMAKHAPIIQAYPRAFRAKMRQKGPLLAARFAKANNSFGLALYYLAQAVLASPILSLRQGFQKIRRRLIRLVRP